MRRTAPKAQGGFDKFQRISWDEALDQITSRFRQIAKAEGPEAILPFSYGGTLGALNNASMGHRFFHRLGASQLERTICSTAGEAGLLSVYGAKYGTEPEQFRHSKYIIAWGANIHGNNIHLWPFIEEARRNRAKLVVIDPYRTRTAALADWHIPIAPGTDVALALGMMNVIIRENLYDADYVANATIGFDELRKRAAEYTPERVANWTGIPAEDVVRLAREYATTRPAAIRLNYCIQRLENGGMATRSVAMLPCLIGSWKEIGGGLQMSLSGAYPHDKEALRRTDLMRTALGRPARTINMVELGKALTEVNDPPVKALFVYNSNPAAVCPNHNKVVRGLMRDDLFTVVHEQFLTDTTDYADIVLPATTFFEHKDLQTAYGHYYLQVSNQAIEPLGECRSNVEMFRALAERMGFTEPGFRESVDEMIDRALAKNHPWLEGITRERLEREGHVRLNLPTSAKKINGYFLPFAEGKFPTPSGKAEFYSTSLAEQGLDPVGAFVPPSESRNAAHREYPLEMLARKADNFLNSSFCNHNSHRPLENGRIGILEITQADAEPRQIREGDTVEVFNQRGSMRLVARVADSIRPGLVCARLDWAKLSNGGVNVNVLTSDRLTDMGGGPAFYSALVEVRQASVLRHEDGQL
jgi:anaerobic selenocysteine-containing dehydrogenase